MILYHLGEPVELDGSVPAGELAAQLAARHESDDSVRLLADPTKRRPRVLLVPKGPASRVIVQNPPPAPSISRRIPNPSPALGAWAQREKERAEARAKLPEPEASTPLVLTDETESLLTAVARELSNLFAARCESEKADRKRVEHDVVGRATNRSEP